MLMLPKKLGALALACAKESARYSLTGLRVEEFQGDLYRLTATDGKILAIVRGQGETQPAYDDMLRSGNDLWSYVVPGAAWQKTFTSAKANENVGIVAQEEGQSILLAVRGTTKTEEAVQGTWPKIESVLPAGPAILGVKFDPSILIRAMTIAQSILGGDSAIWLLHWGEGKPMGFCGRTADGLLLDILVMPLISPNGKDGSRPVLDDEDDSGDGGSERPEPPEQFDHTDPAVIVERETDNGCTSNGYHQPPLPEAVETAPLQPLPEPARVVRPKPKRKKK